MKEWNAARTSTLAPVDTIPERAAFDNPARFMEKYTPLISDIEEALALLSLERSKKTGPLRNAWGTSFSST